jgi:hypothetical protein
LIFINEFPTSVSSKTRLFADDCILYRNIYTKEDCKVLQEDLHRLERWEKAWGMEFHLWKCNSMSSTRPRSPFEHRYTLKGHILEDVKEAKYLGLTLSSNLTWNNHIGNITSKANKLLGSLRRNLKIINESTKENAYKAIVRSNLEYCYKQSGHHIQKRTKMKLKKSKGEQVVLSQEDITKLAVYLP